MSKLSKLQSLEVVGIEIPNKIEVPEEVKGLFSYEEWKVFGAFCNKNPKLMKDKDLIYFKNVAKCIKATSNGKFDDFTKDPKNLINHPLYIKWSQYYQNIKDEKALLRKDPKWKEANQKRVEFRKEKYAYCILDGEVTPIQSFTIEPEGIFEGRPGCPDQGLWKTVASSKEIVVNTNSKNKPVLIKDDKEYEFDGQISWNPDNHYLAVYPIYIGIPNQKPIAKKMAKIMFSAQSKVKKEGQNKKYEASESLMIYSSDLINKLMKEFKTKPSDTTVALYCLFFKGIRIGDKNPTRNGTKGLLSLEWNKDVFRKGNKICFDFIGKDSVRDKSNLDCEDYIADSIERIWLKSGKLKTSKKEITDWVQSIADISFTPKLARTMVAAKTMINALDEVVVKYKLTPDSPIELKKLAFEEANMKVAHQLNHQRGVSKAAKQEREDSFKNKKSKLAERESKVNQLNISRKEKIKKLKKDKKDGWKDKVSKLEALIEKSESKLKITSMNINFKQSEMNFTGATSKAAYIDSKIIARWCDMIKLPLERVYTKTQLGQFENRLGS